jgi:hypothetical protein
MKDHSDDHGNSTEECFPGFVIDVGAAVLEATHNLLMREGADLRDRAAAAGEDFLIAVGPGPKALRQVLSGTNVDLLEERSIGDRTSFSIAPEKLTFGHLKRLAALAARAISNVDYLYDLVASGLELPMTQRRSLMAILALHADPGKQEPSPRVTKFVPDESVRQSLSRKLPDPSFLADITPAPYFERGADEARWFLQLGRFEGA